MSRRDIFEAYPDLSDFIERAHAYHHMPVEELKTLVILVSELSYRDGYCDGIAFLMRELLGSEG